MEVSWIQQNFFIKKCKTTIDGKTAQEKRRYCLIVDDSGKELFRSRIVPRVDASSDLIRAATKRYHAAIDPSVSDSA